MCLRGSSSYCKREERSTKSHEEKLHETHEKDSQKFQISLVRLGLCSLADDRSSVSPINACSALDLLQLILGQCMGLLRHTADFRPSLFGLCALCFADLRHVIHLLTNSSRFVEFISRRSYSEKSRCQGEYTIRIARSDLGLALTLKLLAVEIVIQPVEGSNAKRINAARTIGLQPVVPLIFWRTVWP